MYEWQFSALKYSYIQFSGTMIEKYDDNAYEIVKILKVKKIWEILRKNVLASQKVGPDASQNVGSFFQIPGSELVVNRFLCCY